jgi:drug/metabolite transporter (DMT)-like permease
MATLAAATAVVCWCWSGPAFAEGARAMGAMPYLAMGCVVGTLTGIAIHKSQGHSVRELIFLPFRLIVMGFLGMSVYTVLLCYAVGIASPGDLGQVVLINYLWPIELVILGFFLLPERPRVGLALAGVVLGFLGIMVARGFDALMTLPTSLLPHAMSLAGATLWALYSVLVKRWKVPEKVNGSILAFALCGVLAAVVGIWTKQWHPVTFDAGVIFWVLFIGIGPIGTAYYLWEIGIKRGAVHMAAVLANFTPIGSAVLMGLLFRETLNLGLVAGAVLIAIGAYLGKKSMGKA